MERITVRSANATIWRESLTSYLRHRRSARAAWPTPDQLDARQTWQRRVSGGAMLQLLDYIVSPAAMARFPVLHDQPLDARVFIFTTDLSGAVAARELIAPESQHAIWLLREEWRAWLNDPLCDSDDTFAHHYECWSVWHQDIDPAWNASPPPGAALWVHEEGWAIAENTGRGAQHLWAFDGAQPTLLKQDITSWVEG